MASWASGPTRTPHTRKHNAHTHAHIHSLTSHPPVHASAREREKEARGQGEGGSKRRRAVRQPIPSGLWQVAQLAARLDGALVQSEVAAQRREAERWRGLCERNAGWRDAVVGQLVRPQVRRAPPLPSAAAPLHRRTAVTSPLRRPGPHHRIRSVGNAPHIAARPLPLAARRHAAAAAAAAATAPRQRLLARRRARRRTRGGRRARAALPALRSLLSEHTARQWRGQGRRQGGRDERSGAARSAAGENGLSHSSTAREG